MSDLISPIGNSSLQIRGGDAFVVEHPDLRRLLPNLLGTYVACQRQRLQGEPADLEDAYRHVYLNRGGCSWCQYHLNILKESLEMETVSPAI